MKKILFYNFKNNKKSNFMLLISFIAILSVIIFIFNCKSSYLKFLDYIVDNYYDARRIDAINFDLTYDEMIDEISSIDHVLDVFLYEKYSTALDVSDFEQKMLYINPGEKGFLPKAIYGRNIENSNEIICPIKMAISSTSGFSTDFIDMSKYLNKTLHTSKKIYYFYEYGNEPKIIDEKKYDLKIVGLYDYSAFGDEPYYCYMKKNEIGRIINETKEVYAENFWPDNYVTEDSEDSGIYVWLQVMIDENENVKYVENELDRLGYEHEVGYYINYDFFNYLDIIVNLIVLFTLIILAVVLYLNIDRNLKKEKNEMLILNSIGYNRKQISIILLSNVLIPFVISFILSILLNYVAYYILNIYIENNAQTVGLVLKFDILYLFILIVLFIIIFILLFKNIYNKTEKNLRRKIDGISEVN